MNAKEFVRKFGWDEAKKLLSTQGKTIAELRGEFTEKQLKVFQGYIIKDCLMSMVELKALVDAYEFVRAHKSIEVAKKYCDLHDPYGTSNHYNSLRAKIELVGEL